MTAYAADKLKSIKVKLYRPIFKIKRRKIRTFRCMILLIFNIY